MMFFLSNSFERRLGTAFTAIDLYIKSTIVQLFYCAFVGIFIVPFFNINPMMFFSQGFFCGYFIYIVLMSLKEPEKVIDCCGLPILNKYYPVIFILIFSLMNGMPMFDLIMAYLVGYLMVRYPAFESYTQPPIKLVRMMEGVLAPLDLKLGKLIIHQSSGPEPSNYSRNNTTQSNTNNNNGSSSNSGSVFRSFGFSNGGVRIGGTDLPSNQINPRPNYDYMM